MCCTFEQWHQQMQQQPSRKWKLWLAKNVPTLRKLHFQEVAQVRKREAKADVKRAIKNAWRCCSDRTRQIMLASFRENQLSQKAAIEPKKSPPKKTESKKDRKKRLYQQLMSKVASFE